MFVLTVFGFRTIVITIHILCLDHKAEVDICTKSTRHTALLVAAEFGYNNVIKKLLLNGANRHHKMNKGKQQQQHEYNMFNYVLTNTNV